MGAVRIIKNDEGEEYPIVVLKQRDVCCSDLNEERFVEYMVEDVGEATDIYINCVYPEIIASLKRQKERYIANVINRERTTAMRYALAKYKRQSAIDRYVEKRINAAVEKEERIDYTRGVDERIGYYDFNDSWLAANNVHCSCRICIEPNIEMLKRAFIYMKDSPYFRKAIGWRFQYRCVSEDCPKRLFGASVRLLYDEETEREVQEKNNRYSNGIESFYRNSTYFGD